MFYIIYFAKPAFKKFFVFKTLVSSKYYWSFYNQIIFSAQNEENSVKKKYILNNIAVRNGLTFRKIGYVTLQR